MSCLVSYAGIIWGFIYDQSINHYGKEVTLARSSTLDRVCYEYGHLGHLRKWYPSINPMGWIVLQQQHLSQAIVPASREGSSFRMYHPQLGQGGPIIGRGDTHPNNGGDQAGRGSTQPGRCGAHNESRAQFYGFPGRPKAKASNIVIIGTLLVCDQMVISLFDPGSTFLYIYLLCYWSGCDL